MSFFVSRYATKQQFRWEKQPQSRRLWRSTWTIGVKSRGRVAPPPDWASAQWKVSGEGHGTSRHKVGTKGYKRRVCRAEARRYPGASETKAASICRAVEESHASTTPLPLLKRGPQLLKRHIRPANCFGSKPRLGHYLSCLPLSSFSHEMTGLKKGIR